MACPACSGNSPCWSLMLLTPSAFQGNPGSEKSLVQIRPAHEEACRALLPISPFFSASFNKSGRGAVSGLPGRREEAEPGRWSAQDSLGEGQWAWQGRQGWHQRQTQPLQPDVWASPDSAASGCGGGNWGFGQLESSLRSRGEARAQLSASNHHVGLFHARPGAGMKGLRPCFPFHSGTLSLKGNTPLLSVVF